MLIFINNDYIYVNVKMMKMFKVVDDYDDETCVLCDYNEE
jgi:hypothetical protein